MKFLFASDSFKGSLTSEQTISLLTKAANEIFPGCECIGVPVADGGEGTVNAVVSAPQSQTHRQNVPRGVFSATSITDKWLNR